MAIDRLNSVDEVSASDLLAIFSTANGSDRKLAVSALLTFLRANLALNGLATQYAGPTATGFNVAVTQPDALNTGTWLALTPAAAYAAGTITLPAVAGVLHGQELLVSTTQTVTTLTIAANGATLAAGMPTTITAATPFRLKFDAVLDTWYRA